MELTEEHTREFRIIGGVETPTFTDRIFAEQKFFVIKLFISIYYSYKIILIELSPW